MKLISLNMWWHERPDANERSATINYLLQHNPDIICLQEATAALTSKSPDPRDVLHQLSAAFPKYTLHFAPLIEGYHPTAPQGFRFGNAMLVRHGVVTDHWCLPPQEYSPAGLEHRPRQIQVVDIDISGKRLRVVNVHGCVETPDKSDNTERLTQSLLVRSKVEGTTIICGDFNTWPNTKSMATVREGMRDLGEEHNITQTRNRKYPFGPEVSDYMIVSPTLHVVSFRVESNELSDHLPLVLEFDL